MSFAAQMKRELTQIEAPLCCMHSELLTFMRMNSQAMYVDDRHTYEVTTENATIARRLFYLLKMVWRVQGRLIVHKKTKLKKNNVYILRVTDHVSAMLEAVNSLDSSQLKTVCCRRAVLRGAFLAGGSIHSLESSSYHLEITCADATWCQALCTIANTFALGARMIARKRGYVMYIKESEKISEMINVIGAHRSLLQYEDVRIVRDVRNTVNRVVNCETANVNKTVHASMRQVANIHYILAESGLETLPEKLREIAILRLQHPDLSLKEFGEMLGGRVSKSGIHHRLRKLDAWAQQLRQMKGSPQDT